MKPRNSPIAHIRLGYGNRLHLGLFVLLLLVSQILFVFTDIAGFGALGMRAACSMAVTAMVFDMFIMDDVWANRPYVAHHAITALACAIGCILPQSFLGASSGVFIAYLFLGATVKRLRIMRNWATSHRDLLNRFLRSLYRTIGRVDLIIIPAYLLYYGTCKLCPGAGYAPLLLLAAGASLLVLRVVLP